MARARGSENGTILPPLSLNRNGVWMPMLVGDTGAAPLG